MQSRCALVLFASVVVAAFCAKPCPAYYWSPEYVDWYGQAGLDASLVLAGSTRYVAYTASGGLYLAASTGAAWTQEYVAEAGFGGGWCSAAPAPPGPPAIAFIDDTGDVPALRYARKSGQTWVTEYVDSAGWLPDYVSLKMDSAGAPAIAYASSSAAGMPAALKLARRAGTGAWSLETIATIGDVTGPSLAFDGSSMPAVSFVDAATGAVKLARRSGSTSWTIETVAGTTVSPASWYTSLAFIKGATPCVAYYLSAGSLSVNLAFASKQSLSWVREVVHPGLPAGSPQYCSLAVDASGRPAIAYLEPQSQTLSYARRIAAAWRRETADASSMCGYRPSLLFDAADRPAIAYVDIGFSAVKYAATLPVGLESAKLQPDGSLVDFSGVVASTAAGELPGMLYVQSAGRASGVQVYFGEQSPSGVARGSVLRVEGCAGTRNGERCVLWPEVSVTGAATAPLPLKMNNAAAGGGDLFFDPFPPAIGQQGVNGAAGLNNIGLLVRTAGRVTSTGDGYLYIDDGSGLRDGAETNGTPNAGVRVTAAAAGFVPGDFVSVTGISSCFTTGAGLLARQILPRDSADLVLLDR